MDTRSGHSHLRPTSTGAPCEINSDDTYSVGQGSECITEGESPNGGGEDNSSQAVVADGRLWPNVAISSRRLPVQ